MEQWPFNFKNVTTENKIIPSQLKSYNDEVIQLQFKKNGQYCKL